MKGISKDQVIMKMKMDDDEVPIASDVVLKQGTGNEQYDSQKRTDLPKQMSMYTSGDDTIVTTTSAVAKNGTESETLHHLIHIKHLIELTYHQNDDKYRAQ